jgi:hypothetical protein
MILLWLLATALLTYVALRAATAAVRLLLWVAVGVVRFICWV